MRRAHRDVVKASPAGVPSQIVQYVHGSGHLQAVDGLAFRAAFMIGVDRTQVVGPLDSRPRSDRDGIEQHSREAFTASAGLQVLAQRTPRLHPHPVRDGHDPVHFTQHRLFDQFSVDHDKTRIRGLEFGNDSAGSGDLSC